MISDLDQELDDQTWGSANDTRGTGCDFFPKHFGKMLCSIAPSTWQRVAFVMTNYFCDKRVSSPIQLLTIHTIPNNESPWRMYLFVVNYHATLNLVYYIV